MSEAPTRRSEPIARGVAYRAVSSVGRFTADRIEALVRGVRYVGDLTALLVETSRWSMRGLLSRRVKFGWSSLTAQMIRFGVRCIPIILLVQLFIGLILALQMAPTLSSYGQLERVADVVGIAVIRELGPLLTAVVLSGFAGASIAAEVGAMVETEEIKALRAHALHPVRFLVVPRVLATTVMIVVLAVIADYIGVMGGFLASVLILDVPARSYLNLTQAAVSTTDLLTGLVKAAVFGGVIALIACHEGFSVRGGPAGVGRATTATVVKSIVALIGIDAVFTSVFYVLGI
jgi:phospholipid/cholesterol/gamma-HCH transport system permease protein